MNRNISLLFLLLLWNYSVMAMDFYRLFTTPEQRQTIDTLRFQEKPKEKYETPALSEQKQEEVIPEPPPYISFNGVVLRNSKPFTLWLNNSNTWTSDSFQVDTETLVSGELSLFLNKQKKSVKLKPGQTLNTMSGVILEGYENKSRGGVKAQ